MIKHTYKIDKLIELVASKPDAFAVKPDWNVLTNSQAEQYAHAHGYSWNRQKHEWFFSPIRARLNTSAVRGENGRSGARRVQIRLMGPLDALAQIAGDFAEIADLIGLHIIEVSAPKPNGQGAAWGRVYIIAERM